MSKKRRSLLAVVMMIVIILSQAVVFAEVVDPYVVEIGGIGFENQLKLTLEDLKSMPEEAQIEEAYIYNSKTGEKTANVKGVSLAYVLNEKAGTIGEDSEILFEASDGYDINPQLLKDVLNEDLKYVLAYEINGEPIDNDDNPDTDEIVVYRKVKEAGEFNTVFKLVNKITVAEASPAVEEETEEDAENTVDIVFTDITEEYKFAEPAIMDLAKRGIINGIGQGIYLPGKELSRSEFAKIIVESLGYEKSQYTGEFGDVAADYWAAEYIQTAADKGLFLGNAEGDFMPLKDITRQEMAVVAARAAVIAQKEGSEKISKFTMDKSAYLDKDNVPQWAANQVAWLESVGAFQGVADENFNPEKVVNRAEAAVIIYNTLFK